MAGAGTKLFEAGAILTANQVNTYLMDQVVARFATIGARDAAFGSPGQPALSEGRLSYLDSTNKVYIYTGSAWEEIGSQIEAGEVGTTELANDAVTSAKILNETILNEDISPSASIALSKLATGALPTAITVASANIVNGTIVDDDISSSASIALSKLATGALPTSITVASANIVNGTIVNDDVSASAAIAYSKLSLSNSITTTDLATGAARAGFRSPIIAQQGATHTIAASDVGGMVILSSCTSVVIPTSDATFTVGDRIDFLQTGSQVVTFTAASPQTVGAFDSQTKLGGQFAVATLVKYAANTWVLVGNITS